MRRPRLLPATPDRCFCGCGMSDAGPGRNAASIWPAGSTSRRKASRYHPGAHGRPVSKVCERCNAQCGAGDWTLKATLANAKNAMNQFKKQHGVVASFAIFAALFLLAVRCPAGGPDRRYGKIRRIRVQVVPGNEQDSDHIPLATLQAAGKELHDYFSVISSGKLDFEVRFIRVHLPKKYSRASGSLGSITRPLRRRERPELLRRHGEASLSSSAIVWCPRSPLDRHSAMVQ